MRQFLRELFENGNVTVPAPDVPFESATECEEIIRAFDRAARNEMALSAPALSMPAAMWAAERLAQIARLVVARDCGPDEFAAVFSVKCPEALCASTAYSVDVFLRYLPSLVTFIERLSPGDPLIESVSGFASAWPLSSFGISKCAVPSDDALGPICADGSLVELYAARVLVHEDAARVGNPAIDAALRRAIGAHPELSPQIAKSLNISLQTTT